MAFRHGKTAVVTIAGTDISSFCTSLDLSMDIDTADTTTMGSSWKSAIAGVAGAKLTLSGDYDGTASTGPAAVLVTALTGAVAVAIVHKPGGTASGQRTNSFSGIVTGYSESSPVGGVITFKADILATGTVTSTTQ